MGSFLAPFEVGYKYRAGFIINLTSKVLTLTSDSLDMFKGGRPMNPIWDHFHRVVDGPKVTAHCKLCQSEYIFICLAIILISTIY